MYDEEIVKAVCKKSSIPYGNFFQSETKKLQGKIGTFNDWRSLVFGENGYDFVDDDGNNHWIPLNCVKQIGE